MSVERKTFLPLAPESNMSLVRNGADPSSAEILGGTGKPLCPHLGEAAIRKLSRFQDEYNIASTTPIDEIARIKAESKGDLVLRSNELFKECAKEFPDLEERLNEASIAGCGVVAAYLEMIARMQAKNAKGDFDRESYKMCAKKSAASLVLIASTSRDADGYLTQSAMNWSLNQVSRMSLEEKYAGLELNEEFFVMDIDGGVRLRGDDETRKRIHTESGRNFDMSKNKHEILFGCPFRSRIPLLAYAMAEAMLENGLAEVAYNDTRRVYE